MKLDYWECPACGKAYLENRWLITGKLVKPSLLRRLLARSRGRYAEPYYRLWHTCPHKHSYDRGAPYAGFPTPGKHSKAKQAATRAIREDGMPVLFTTLLGVRGPQVYGLDQGFREYSPKIQRTAFDLR